MGKKRLLLVDNVAINPVQKTGCPLNTLRTPFKVLFRGSRKEAEEPDGIGTILVDQIIGVDNVSF